MQNIPRKNLPRTQIPLFFFWIASSNILAIVMTLIFYLGSLDLLGPNPTLSLWVIVVINVLSILLLYPLLKMDPIKPFMKSAVIWFGIVAVIYILIGAYVLLIPAVIQALGDVWFHWELKKAES